MFNLIIAIETDGHAQLIHNLKRHSKVTHVSGPYPYAMDKSYSQVHITTSMTADEWNGVFYKTKYGSCVVAELQDKE